MDDDLTQFEAELKRLRPAPLPRGLVARLEAELAPVGRRTSPAWWLWAGVLPVAAAFAVMIVLAANSDGTRTPSPAARKNAAALVAPAPAAFKPIAAENLLYATQDEGLVTLADGTPARRERLSYVDTITWRNPRTNASEHWSVPREEVRVVPVNFQ
mgnify:FL=1